MENSGSFYFWNSKRWMLEDETSQTHGRVMDSVLKNDVIECTRSVASDQETLLRTCLVAAGPAMVFAQCDYAFTTMNNNEITVITMLMLMRVCIFEAVILTEV